MKKIVFYLLIKGQPKLRFTTALSIDKFIKFAKIDIHPDSIIQLRENSKIIGIITVGKYLQYLKSEENINKQ